MLNLFLIYLGAESLDELVSSVMRRMGGAADDKNYPQLLVSKISMTMWSSCQSKVIGLILNVLQYEDDEGDRVLLTADGDLVSAVGHARSLGLKVSTSAYYSLSFYVKLPEHLLRDMQ